MPICLSLPFSFKMGLSPYYSSSEPLSYCIIVVVFYVAINSGKNYEIPSISKAIEKWCPNANI